MVPLRLAFSLALALALPTLIRILPVGFLTHLTLTLTTSTKRPRTRLLTM